MLLVNAIVLTLCFMLAQFIIEMLYGVNYENVVVSFGILITSYFIGASFMKIGGNILAMLRKINVLLDIYLLKTWAAMEQQFNTFGSNNIFTYSNDISKKLFKK